MCIALITYENNPKLGMVNWLSKQRPAAEIDLGPTPGTHVVEEENRLS